MNALDVRKIYSLQGDGNALGGYLEAPIAKVIPTLAPVSLPPVGGFAFARSERFTLDEIISCSSAYTRVTGQECREDGASAILVTAVIEDLNILEVVRADRIVTQLSITIPEEPGSIGISIAGTAFEGLQLAGPKRDLTLKDALHNPRDPKGAGGRLTWTSIREVGRVQGEALLNDFKDGSEDAHQWVIRQHRRMTSAPQASGCGYALASVVDTVPASGGCRSHGHIVDIPGFGQFIFGELSVSCESVQLVAISAELGCCPYRGRISICRAAGGGGQHGT
jgi:hypothetical protein